jgi:hypothetical protein
LTGEGEIPPPGFLPAVIKSVEKGKIEKNGKIGTDSHFPVGKMVSVPFFSEDVFLFSEGKWGAVQVFSWL